MNQTSETSAVLKEIERLTGLVEKRNQGDGHGNWVREELLRASPRLLTALRVAVDAMDPQRCPCCKSPAGPPDDEYSLLQTCGDWPEHSDATLTAIAQALGAEGGDDE